MRIGVVDLDTSHPEAWVPIEIDLGHEVVGVWDGGSVHRPEFVEQFAEQHGIATVYSSLDDMAADVDCAVIHGCDWDTHVAKSRPFVEAGKSVLIDKPLAGNPTDLAQLVRWESEGARITGGSALRFCPETAEWLDRPVSERGVPRTVFGGCGVDEFNYGIHAYSMVLGIMGEGVHAVRHLAEGHQRRVLLEWDDGRAAVIAVGATGGWLPFHATIVTEKSVAQFQPAVDRLYEALLRATLPYLAGEAEAPVPLVHLAEAERCALAARQSWLDGDVEVPLARLDDGVGYDGSAFAVQYRKLRYPG